MGKKRKGWVIVHMLHASCDIIKGVSIPCPGAAYGLTRERRTKEVVTGPECQMTHDSHSTGRVLLHGVRGLTIGKTDSEIWQSRDQP